MTEIVKYTNVIDMLTRKPLTNKRTLRLAEPEVVAFKALLLLGFSESDACKKLIADREERLTRLMSK